MKAKKKTNHLMEEADKIEQIPEEKNDGREGQDEAIKAKKPRKNRFLARLRKTWARIIGCMRCCCTSIQEERSAEELPQPNGLNMEELPGASGINMEEEIPEPSVIKMEDSKAKLSAEVKEENVEENQNIKTDHEEAEVVETDRFVEQAIEAEYQRLLDLIHSQEDLYIQYYASQQEILAEYDHIHDHIHITEDLHNGEDGLEKADKAKESQRASCEMPGPSHISSRDNEPSKGKENEDNKGKDNRININEENEECRSKQMSSSKSSSLDYETPKELYRSMKTSQRGSSDDGSDFWSLDNETVEKLFKSIKTSESGSSDDRSDFWSLENETLEELFKSTKTSQSGSSHDEEPTTSDICSEKLKQPREETPSTVPLTLQSFTFHQTLGDGTFGEVFLAKDIIRKECVAIKVSSKCLFTEYKYSFVERNILELSHESPFLIHGLATFHTKACVYFVLELATRGDLYAFMRKNRCLHTPTIQFITAEVICGTQFLHKKDIIHRDLKPENILLTADGHLKLTDFGLSVMGVYEKTKEKPRGTPGFMAPEMVMGQEHGRGVDYFAIGVILYNLYTSKLPFPGKNIREIQHFILHYTPFFSEYLTPDAVDILQGLLCKDQNYRLGVIGDIKKHQFFSGINWEDMEARRIEPPAIMTAPSVDLNMDETLDYWELVYDIRPEHQKIFKEFSFVCPDWSQHYHPVNNVTI